MPVRERVLLVAPLPPPRGGISTWAEVMLKWASGSEEVEIDVVDTAPRWREVYDLRRWRRILLGLRQGIRDFGDYVRHVLFRRPVAVHITTSGGLALARDLIMLLLARLLRLRAIYHLHFGRMPSVASEGGIERASFWLTLRLSSVVVVLDSPSAAAAMCIHPGASVWRIPNLIDTAEWAPPVAVQPSGDSIGRSRILYLGWVIGAKGMRELVTACAKLAFHHEFELALAGPCDPGFRRELQTLAGQGPGWLCFLGEIPHAEIQRLLASVDVVVLPSFSEAFPYVILEAMSMAKAIVASSVGAIPLMLADGDDLAGVLVPPGDAAALESALKLVLTDSTLRVDLGQRARRAVQRRFSVEAVRGEYLKLWMARRQVGDTEYPSPDGTSGARRCL